MFVLYIRENAVGSVNYIFEVDHGYKPSFTTYSSVRHAVVLPRNFEASSVLLVLFMLLALVFLFVFFLLSFAKSLLLLRSRQEYSFLSQRF